MSVSQFQGRRPLAFFVKAVGFLFAVEFWRGPHQIFSWRAWGRGIGQATDILTVFLALWGGTHALADSDGVVSMKHPEVLQDSGLTSASSDPSIDEHHKTDGIGASARSLQQEADANTPAMVTWLVQYRIQASHAPLLPGYWQQQSLQSTSTVHWWHWQLDAGAQFEAAGLRWQVGQSRQAYLQANSNALLMAALDAKGQDMATVPTNGERTYPLQAEIWQLSGRGISAQWSGRAGQDEQWSWQLEPQWLQIQDYRHERADLSWRTVGGRSTLQGQLQRTGMRRYGFLIDEQPDAGWAALLHARLHWRSPYGSMLWQMQNLWSTLQFNNVHFLRSQYQVQADNGQIVLRDVPSVDGAYGMQRLRARLPRLWQWQWQPQLGHDDRPMPLGSLGAQPTLASGVQLGALGLGQQAHPWVGYSMAWACGQTQLSTIPGVNWQWSLACQWPQSRWMLAASVSTDARMRYASWSQLQLSWRW